MEAPGVFRETLHLKDDTVLAAMHTYNYRYPERRRNFYSNGRKPCR